MVLNKKSFLEKLDHITGILLDSQSSFLDLRNACVELYELFIRISEFEITKEDDHPVFTHQGKAISPSEAALCVQDVARTTFFLRGIHSAIGDHLKKYKHPVNILYTGTGPFATLLLPLVTKFTSQQLRMMLIEINSVSYRCLEKAISNLEIGSYVTHMENTDAGSFRLPSFFEPDIILSETMNAGLKNEQQWSIVSNLLPQCNVNTVLIPAEIEVSVALLGKGLSPFDDFLHVGTLFNLNRETVMESALNPGKIKVINEGVTINLPSIQTERYSKLALVTKVTVYKEHEIAYNQSGITLPVKLLDILPGKPVPAELIFIYEKGKLPGFHFKIIN